MCTENPDKARVMIEHLFPLIKAQIRDITGSVDPEESESIPRPIFLSELEEVFKILHGNTAPSPDGVPNRFLKCYRSTLSGELGCLFNTCFLAGYYPRKLKESITIFIRKTQKPTYDIPKA